MSGDIKLISIKMNPIKLNQNEIIERLKSYIKYIKSIPGVNELISSYENKSTISNKKLNITPKSNIIPNFEDFKFIYEELCQKLNKKE